MAPDRFLEIYANHADEYEHFIAAEDYEGNILKALREIMPLEGIDVVETGAGTGRLTMMLAPLAKSIHAYDSERSMIAVAERKLRATDLDNWRLGVADHRDLPPKNASADLGISGWSMVYAALWSESDWQENLDKALGELTRIVRPGGFVIILETMGTGFETPTPPEPLKPYFARLDALGFKSKVIRTDYKFASLDDSVAKAGFFFGPEMAEQILKNNWVILPECTGIWWKQV